LTRKEKKPPSGPAAETPRKALKVTLDAAQFYPNSTPSIVVLFDVAEPGMAEHFHAQRAVWGPDSDVEMLDLDHAVLIIKPGSALESAA
jgi:hypothetical protein